MKRSFIKVKSKLAKYKECYYNVDHIIAIKSMHSAPSITIITTSDGAEHVIDEPLVNVLLRIKEDNKSIDCFDDRVVE
jgi:uncharacterized protein YlzI (FlbEa/FlbD family)